MTWDVLFLAWELIWIDIRKAPTFLFSFCLTKNVWTKLLQHDWTKTKYYAVEKHAYSLFRLSWKRNISDISWFCYRCSKFINMIWMFHQEYVRMKWKKCNEHGNWKIDFMEKGCVNLQNNIPNSHNVRAVNVPAVL